MDLPARIAIQVADANVRPGRDAHFAMDRDRARFLLLFVGAVDF
jgi:hypothetical protein